MRWACPNETMIWIAMASSAHHAPCCRLVRIQRIQSNVHAKGINFRPGSIHCRAAGSQMSMAQNADRATPLPSWYRLKGSIAELLPPLCPFMGGRGTAVPPLPTPPPDPAPRGRGEEFAAPSRLKSTNSTSFRTSRKGAAGRRQRPRGVFCPASGPMRRTP